MHLTAISARAYLAIMVLRQQKHEQKLRAEGGKRVSAWLSKEELGEVNKARGNQSLASFMKEALLDRARKKA